MDIKQAIIKAASKRRRQAIVKMAQVGFKTPTFDELAGRLLPKTDTASGGGFNPSWLHSPTGDTPASISSLGSNRNLGAAPIYSYFGHPTADMVVGGVGQLAGLAPTIKPTERGFHGAADNVRERSNRVRGETAVQRADESRVRDWMSGDDGVIWDSLKGQNNLVSDPAARKNMLNESVIPGLAARFGGLAPGGSLAASSKLRQGLVDGLPASAYYGRGETRKLVPEPPVSTPETIKRGPRTDKPIHTKSKWDLWGQWQDSREAARNPYYNPDYSQVN